MMYVILEVGMRLVFGIYSHCAFRSGLTLPDPSENKFVFLGHRLCLRVL